MTRYEEEVSMRGRIDRNHFGGATNRGRQAEKGE